MKVDGQEIEVDLDELRNGYSRQQAYTKRSMELAEQRKAFEAEQLEVKGLRTYTRNSLISCLHKSIRSPIRT